MSKPETIKIDEVEYVRKDSLTTRPIPGKRAVVVVDRGWIFAGDVTEAEGRIVLTRAVHVLSWSSGGFAGLVAEPSKCGARLFALGQAVNLPTDAEIFRVPVPDDWGLK